MNDSQPGSPSQPGSSRFLLLVIVGLVAAGAGYYAYSRSENASSQLDEFAVLKPFFARLGASSQLAPEYVDLDPVDLVADAPKDPAKRLVVEEIAFTVVGTSDEARLAAEREEWKDLMAALEKATGKKVRYLAEAIGPTQQMEAFRGGKLHITAFNTGAVPTAVNSAGFVPLFVPADGEGQFSYRMQILVRAGSAIQKPEDLRNKKVGFVALSSNSGAKAPMQILKEKFGLLPGRDYRFTLIGDHYGAIGEVVYGTEFDAVCVASDLKDRAVASGKIRFRSTEKELKADQFLEIYTSEPFPPLCFGIPHDLPADLRSVIEKVFLEYRFAGTSAKRYTQQGKVGFARVDYEKDWKLVREVDAALSRFAQIP